MDQNQNTLFHGPEMQGYEQSESHAKTCTKIIIKEYTSFNRKKKEPRGKVWVTKKRGSREIDKV